VTLRFFLDPAREHSMECAKRFEREPSEFVFTSRYGRPLTYDGLRAAIKLEGNPFKLPHLRAGRI
jgi:hypothetical protein